MEMFSKFKGYLINTIPQLVIKYKKLASVGETLDTTKSADLYIAAKLDQDSFITYRKFPKQTLLKAGYPDDVAILYSIDKYKIPYSDRELVMSIERQRIINEYVEQNEYYRMLNGLPRLEEESLYLPDATCVSYDIPIGTPVHLISQDTVVILETDGILTALRTTYPDKKYLNYLGIKKIDIVTARLADNFEVLYVPRVESDIFFKDLLMTYDECREYFLTVIYNTNLSKLYDKYDNFIAFCIMTMTIQRIMTNIFKMMINRDFYDIETTRMFLESYNVPFVKSFSLTQMRLLVKNLNILLMKKSTDRCLFDLLELLGYTDFDLRKYYLCKQHRLDSDGKPIFPYVTRTNPETGESYPVLDKEAMYEIYFKAVNIKDYDIQSALSDSSTEKESYDRFIINDKTWIDDEKLKEKLLSTDFNYVNTKYLNVNIMYKMHKMLFEITYVTRLILDRRTETNKIMVNLPKYSPTPVNLFDMIIALIILVCKKNNMEDNLLTSPSQILSILGFNFKADLDKIKQDILSKPKLYNQEILKYIEKIRFDTPKDVNDMYFNVKRLADILTVSMNSTNNIECYRLYKKLYQTLLVSDLDNSIYSLKDGSIPTTFSDYLIESDLNLYTTIDELEDTMYGQFIDYGTSKLSEMLTDTKYLGYINTADNYLIEGIIKLIKFFKSYTVDVKDMSVIYVMDSKYYNTIRFIEDVKFLSSSLEITDTGLLSYYSDLIKQLTTVLSPDDNLNLKSQQISSVDVTPTDTMSLHDTKLVTSLLEISDKGFLSNYSDLIKQSTSTMSDKDNFTLSSQYRILNKLIPTDTLSLHDGKLIMNSQELNIVEILKLYDCINRSTCTLNSKDNLKMRDTCEFRWEE